MSERQLPRRFAAHDRWRSLEGRLSGLRFTLEEAKRLDDYQDVGRRAREILRDLSNLVFDESMVPLGLAQPRAADTKARLEMYLTFRLAGAGAEALRPFMKATHVLANSLTHDDSATRVEAFAVAQATLLLVRLVADLEGSDLDWFALSTEETVRASRADDAARKRRVAVVSSLRAELGRLPDQMLRRQERDHPPVDRLTTAMWRTSAEEFRAVADPELLRKVVAAYDLLEVEVDLESRWTAARAVGGGVEAYQGRFFANELKRYDRDLWRLACDACAALDQALSADGAPPGGPIVCP